MKAFYSQKYFLYISLRQVGHGMTSREKRNQFPEEN